MPSRRRSRRATPDSTTSSATCVTSRPARESTPPSASTATKSSSSSADRHHIPEEQMTDLEHGFERLTGAGVVVPNEVRPSKSSRLYSDKGITDGGGHLSPHMLPQPFLPVNGKGGEDLAGPYEVVEGWPQQI